MNTSNIDFNKTTTFRAILTLFHVPSQLTRRNGEVAAAAGVAQLLRAGMHDYLHEKREINSGNGEKREITAKQTN